MNFEIVHTTRYTYSEKVFLEPHLMRFKPRKTPHSLLHEHHLDILPAPAGMSHQIDPEDNHILFCWFEEMHRELRVTAKSSLETKVYDPFDFLIHPGDNMQIPFQYDVVNSRLLAPSLDTLPLPGPMKVFSGEILKQSDQQTVEFLAELTRNIHSEFETTFRESGEPYHPETTFLQKSGSCRDLAWMQIQMLRNLGIAARFVSGYFHAGSEDPEFELHAWMEAFIPGAGWIGLDPSHGIFSGHHHIPVAASAFPVNTMSISGSYRGKAGSKMTSVVHISVDGS